MNGGICCWGKISGRAGRRFFWVAWCWSVCLIAAVRGDTAADRFVEIRQFIPDIAVDLRYHGSNNFLGRPVQGYAVDRCWITLPAAKQLAKVQAELRRFGFSLKVFDAYRPQQAVDDFLRWVKEPAYPRLKRRFFTSVIKPQLLADGYIAAHSGHSRLLTTGGLSLQAIGWLVATEFLADVNRPVPTIFWTAAGATFCWPIGTSNPIRPGKREILSITTLSGTVPGDERAAACPE